MKLYEELLKTLADHTSAVIYIKDLEGKYILINKQYEKLFSVKNDEVKGKTDLDLFPLDFAEKFMKNDHLVLRSGKVMEIEESAPHKDGMHTYISVKFPVHNQEGKIFGIGGISTDITSRKKMEQELKDYKDNLELRVNEKTLHLHKVKDDLLKAKERIELIEHGLKYAGDAVFFLNLSNSEFAYVNEMACKSLGYSYKELVNMKVYNIDPNKASSHWKKFQSNLLTHKTQKFESHLLRKSGSTFPVEITMHLMQFEGEKYGIVFARDISERKIVEKELIQTKEAAEKASLAKSQFLFRMSHELRTPMNAILGFAQLLEKDPKIQLDNQLNESVAQIIESGNHLLDLINESLDLARIEAGNYDLKIESIEINEFTKSILGMMAPLAEKKEIQLIDKILINEFRVLADRVRLKQVLLNLISNGIKYNNKGGSVTVEAELLESKLVKLHIKDTGIGIQPEKINQIFEPFTRLRNVEREIEGSGIGLSVTKKLLEIMNGNITVESKLGTGSCFTIELPADNELPILETKKFSLEDTIKTNYSTETETKQVLYIEDNLSNIRLVERILSEQPYICLQSILNAREGIEIAKKLQPHLIIMDLDLEELDGISAFKILKQQKETQNIPVIACSAFAMKENIQQALELGFEAYLTKPIDIDEFNRTLQKFL